MNKCYYCDSENIVISVRKENYYLCKNCDKSFPVFCQKCHKNSINRVINTESGGTALWSNNCLNNYLYALNHKLIKTIN